ncbi:hypothetical protein H6F74_18155 [Trichocoleus sp. FACHB-90]|nr:hypothetical protein [Trichocoleus sp. FACHB-90]
MPSTDSTGSNRIDSSLNSTDSRLCHLLQCMAGLAIALFSSRLNPKPNFAMRYTIWFTAY